MTSSSGQSSTENRLRWFLGFFLAPTGIAFVAWSTCAIPNLPPAPWCTSENSGITERDNEQIESPEMVDDTATVRDLKFSKRVPDKGGRCAAQNSILEIEGDQVRFRTEVGTLVAGRCIGKQKGNFVVINLLSDDGALLGSSEPIQVWADNNNMFKKFSLLSGSNFSLSVEALREARTFTIEWTGMGG